MSFTSISIKLMMSCALVVCATASSNPTITTSSIRIGNVANGEQEYIRRYEFNVPQGMITIGSRVKSGDIKILMERSRQRSVLVKAIISKKTFDGFESYRKVPWSDDMQQDSFDKNVIRSSKHLLCPVKYSNDYSFKGGNRLHLELDKPGLYYISVPVDADIDAELTKGDITFSGKDDELTDVKVDAPTKEIKHNGDRSTKFTTRLATKDGHIAVLGVLYGPVTSDRVYKEYSQIQTRTRGIKD